MLLVVITFLLVAVGVVAYIYGAWKLSRYAARVSGGLGMGVLLFPPLTFHFAFFKLEQEGKEFPITMWLFGLVSTIMLIIVFWSPISLVLTGRMGELEKPTGVAESAVAAYGKKENTSPTTETPNDEPTPAPAATNNAPAATNGATGGATGTTGATNNAAAGTNAGGTTSTNTATNGAQ